MILPFGACRNGCDGYFGSGSVLRDKAAVPLKAALRSHLESVEIGMHYSKLKAPAGAPFKVVHKTPQIIAANIKALVDSLLEPLKKASDIAYAIAVLYHAALRIDLFLADGICSVFGDDDRYLEAVEVVHKMNSVVNGTGIVLGAVVKKVSALREVRRSTLIGADRNAVIYV